MLKTNKITLNVEGMTCANCALGIKKKLEKKGLKEVNVSFATGEVGYIESKELDLTEVKTAIGSLGFVVLTDNKNVNQGVSTIEKKFYFTLLFTIPLFLHMFFSSNSLLNNLWVQLALCIPVFIVGLIHFGKSAIGSLKTGVPNMDVLIIIGAGAAFFYSLVGGILYYGTPQIHNYLFFETTATIITLVLLGNVLEFRSVKQTTTAIKDLTALQKITAKKVLSNGSIEETNYHDIRIGDILQVNTGDKIAVDGKIIKGTATINESMISGESIPVEKELGAKVIGGTIVEDGNIHVITEVVGDETVLSKIIKLVKNAQQDMPSIQQLGDRVSAIFVPTVIVISLLTFLISFFVFDIILKQAIMQSIAVLVISCPCAMGLATPTAVMVGIGRAAKKGILIKGGSTLEVFAKSKNIVFDKTGTLTTGKFIIKQTKLYGVLDDQELINILFSLEQHSSHPIAKSITDCLKNKATAIKIQEIVELKGVGIEGKDKLGNLYQLGANRIDTNQTKMLKHSLFLFKNKKLIAGIDIEDQLKENVAETIKLLNNQGLNTILLSGDRKEKCDELANKIGITKVYSEQLPEDKIKVITELEKLAPTVMIGDGINDAPALVKASVGISLSKATQIAVQSAQVVLLNNKDIHQVYEAYLISKHTLKTIKQNLFWAFFYNVVAIPIAAFGFLSPMIAALAMAFSDVIVIGNSIRLKTKKML